MLRLVTTAQMRSLEQETAQLGLPGPALMENAGRAVSDVIRGRFSPRDYRHALIVVGPGNNGGDGLVTARHLHDAGYRVMIYAAARAAREDAKVLLLRQRGIPLVSLAEDPALTRFRLMLDDAALVVDAVFGTGTMRPAEGALAGLLDVLAQAAGTKKVIAIDLPSGVNADTGAVTPHAAAASVTVALGCPKRGLVLGEAVDRVGEIVVTDIGIPATLGREETTFYATTSAIAPRLPVRPPSGHKGTFGRVMIVAGSALYTGAPVLAALGSERSGAGLVTLACPASVRASLAAHTLESTFLPLPDDGAGALGPAAVDPLIAALDDYRALLIGPGLGRAPATADFLAALLPRLKDRGRPLVIDADALTLLSAWPRWWERLAPETILTPHAGEMARLVGAQSSEDRLDLARHSAATWGTVVVFKGAYSIVADPAGRLVVLPFANPALATAGTGDVLAGTILGLLGQGLDPFDAAVVGGFVHGTAGQIVQRRIGPAGALAHDLAAALPAALREIRETA